MNERDKTYWESVSKTMMDIHYRDMERTLFKCAVVEQEAAHD